MSGLKVVSLISGGKDSLFSMLHCLRNGHKMVALANLHPPALNNTRSEDLESFMYQTVGHAVIPLYETALGLPLYRQEITGSAVNKSKSYGTTCTDSADVQDETESLVPLLRRVLRAHPEINAVSTGAIMSDYQRTRVESVAIRLGLTPLSYLWQWPFLSNQSPSSLLEDMAKVGQDARIIKVASGGLDESFLWQNVGDQRTIHRLSIAARRFGSEDDGAVLGEGGEYETLAVAGPSPLWKGRIVVPSGAMESVPGSAGCASVRLSVPSVELGVDAGRSADNLPIPSLLESRFQVLLQRLSRNKVEYHPVDMPSPRPGVGLLIEKTDDMQQERGAMLLSQLVGQGSTAADQVRSIMTDAKARLTKVDLGFSDVVYTTIILRDMADFPSINAVYGSYFTTPNPPARVTIASADALPSRAKLMLSMTIARGPRTGLHVQSRSYWAPANIGPYSQAISFSADGDTSMSRAAILVSGQIPLEPASMELIKSSDGANFELQTVLALQHLIRIGRKMEVARWAYAVAFVTTTKDESFEKRRNVVNTAWNVYHEPEIMLDNPAEEDDETFDVWDVRHGLAAASMYSQQRRMDDKTREGAGARPQLRVIAVDSLPRGSAVEWVGYGKAIDGELSSEIPLHLQDLLRAFEEQTEA